MSGIRVAFAQVEIARIAYHAAIRNALSHRGKCDDPKCPGWIVAVVDRFPGVEIECCDQCAPFVLADSDVQALPEARSALASHPATSEEI